MLQARGARRDGRRPDIARFGFTASKGLGGAVIRNRARRRLKEAVRLAAPDHAVQGYDYVLIAREGTVQRRFTEIIKDLERALTKVHAPRPAKTALNEHFRQDLNALATDRAARGHERKRHGRE